RLVYDLDDAIFQRDSFQRKGPKSCRRERLFRATVQSADAIIVGNEFLRRCTAQVDSTRPIHVVPTTVQPQYYRLTRHHRVGSNVRLAWIGSSSTLPGLKLAEDHLHAAAGKVRGLSLRLVCDRRIELKGVHVVLRPWSAATEATELAHTDIGISWLSDDTWSRGKCGLKVLQYMAAGLPVVANRVGMNRHMVVHGETGLLADTPEEWAHAIACLAADPELRSRMGAAGRRLVERDYAVDRWGPRFARIINAVARSGAAHNVFRGEDSLPEPLPEAALPVVANR
ncbi:MAG: glycosyltransferase, partial [Thermoguttaceae bacterium]